SCRNLLHVAHCRLFFFFHAPSTTALYTLSLHDALPISVERIAVEVGDAVQPEAPRRVAGGDRDGVGVGEREHRRGELLARVAAPDRKSTRLNSSHVAISYAVFCLKKKNKKHDLVVTLMF